MEKHKSIKEKSSKFGGSDAIKVMKTFRTRIERNVEYSFQQLALYSQSEIIKYAYSLRNTLRAKVTRSLEIRVDKRGKLYIHILQSTRIEVVRFKSITTLKFNVCDTL